jgi:hypothetical protein
MVPEKQRGAFQNNAKTTKSHKIKGVGGVLQPKYEDTMRENAAMSVG